MGLNELIIWLESGQWIYFATSQIKADKAFQEFTEKCDASGINVDNINVTEVTLRNENSEKIDHIDFKKGV